MLPASLCAKIMVFRRITRIIEVVLNERAVESYSDTFCDGMGLLYESLKGAGCTFIGNRVNSDAYNFSGSIAVEDGYFVGLALDDVNEGNLTQTRIEAWVSELKTNL